MLGGGPRRRRSKLRVSGRTDVLGDGAAWVEATAGRNVDRVRRLALQDLPAPAAARIGLGHHGHQRLRVGMLWVVDDLREDARDSHARRRRREGAEEPSDRLSIARHDLATVELEATGIDHLAGRNGHRQGVRPTEERAHGVGGGGSRSAAPRPGAAPGAPAPRSSRGAVRSRSRRHRPRRAPRLLGRSLPGPVRRAAPAYATPVAGAEMWARVCMSRGASTGAPVPSVMLVAVFGDG